MTSKLVVNTIEADTGISSVSFASSISMSSTSKFHFGDAGIDIGADTNINRPATGVIGFNINSSEKARIDSSGRVLIGTTTAGYSTADDLTISTSGSTGITIRTGTTNQGNIYFADGTSGASQYAGLISYNHNTNHMFFGTNDGTERFRITSDGKIGIGNNNPSYPLVLTYTNNTTYSSSNFIANGLQIENTSTTDNTASGIFFTAKGSGANAGAAHINCIRTANGSGTLTFSTRHNVGNHAERLRITSDGQVRIADADEGLRMGVDAANYKISRDPTGGDAGYLKFYGNQSGYTGYIFSGANGERLRIGTSGQIGIAGANYGATRQTIVSGGASGAVSWSSNPLLLDMDSLGDIDYDGVFLRYRETATVTGNGLVYLGLCKSTTNCPAGRIGVPVGFIPSTVYNGHFRVDKVGITPWPDGSGHRYEYYAIISDYVSSGKLGVFYLTNSTN